MARKDKNTPAGPPTPDATELRGEPPPDATERPSLIVRTIGAAVIIVGMLWMAILVALAALLQPNHLVGVLAYLAAAVGGLLAILLGVAIRRS